MNNLPFLIATLFFLMIGLQIIFFFVPFPLWLSAKLSRVPVGLVDLFVMRTFRKIPPHELVIPAITAQYAGIPISIAKMQSHYMAGGDVQNVVSALIAASKAKIDLNWDTATSIDLAGRNVLEAVQMSVNPKVIQTPLIEAVSHDGIQVKAVCLVTVRANIAKLVGSAGEETVLARVGEGIVTSIGKSRNFKQVLENPDLITEAVLDTGLDAGTAFEILSIDIADIDVGENVGARLQADQAEADIATLAHPLHDDAEFADPNVVKVVQDVRGYALYFSRAPIPWWRDGAPRRPSALALRHIGLYAYRVGALAQFARLPAAELEVCEALEQLRALSHGLRIRLGVIDSPPPRGVDTEADLVAATERLRQAHS